MAGSPCLGIPSRWQRGCPRRRGGWGWMGRPCERWATTWGEPPSTVETIGGIGQSKPSAMAACHRRALSPPKDRCSPSLLKQREDSPAPSRACLKRDGRSRRSNGGSSNAWRPRSLGPWGLSSTAGHRREESSLVKLRHGVGHESILRPGEPLARGSFAWRKSRRGNDARASRRSWRGLSFGVGSNTPGYRFRLMRV